MVLAGLPNTQFPKVIWSMGLLNANSKQLISARDNSCVWNIAASRRSPKCTRGYLQPLWSLKNDSLTEKETYLLNGCFFFHKQIASFVSNTSWVFCLTGSLFWILWLAKCISQAGKTGSLRWRKSAFQS